ncbi:lysin [Companilactobacillus nodensis DSM 19682 = JCM 14932 = NBRC 107160]|uniref:Lysin n=3 Tax=Companilactobacillus nodensis TaxID=460870 RepID=A0A0R1KI67_9LACO|nr:lysin [Companilactobacillus nodensis DSM 19682 = JCM 14932 = NBRC 107160]
MVGLLLAGLFFFSINVDAARTDMVDVSNHNGYMTTANFVDMRNNYGVKSVVTKISEGTYYHDYTAANNISTAQAAGLYINGYHYAKYKTEFQAVAEADYASALAKQDGLPIGAVLVADVEDGSQAGLTKSQMNANNKAFMNQVAKYGYRSDVYTMGSWVNNRFVVPTGTGWIASYPYNASGKSWYSSNNGWQWGSTYKFQGSYGNFDVSQLYTNFYTADQAAKVDPRASISNVVSVKGNDYKAYATFNGKGMANIGTNVISGSDWISASIVAVNDRPYYVIGVDTLIPQAITTFKDKLVINYRSDYGVNAYNSEGQAIKDSNQTFKGGSEWKTSDKLTNVPNVGLCYKVATDEYIPIQYAQGSGFNG